MKVTAHQAFTQQLRRQNAHFAKLSKKEKRIAIAKDVLKQLRAKRFVAKSGVYVRLPIEKEVQAERSPLRFQEIVARSTAPSCEVCALGAAFVSRARLGNMVAFGAHIHNVLAEIFSDTQLFLIEGAFEGYVRTPRVSKFRWRYLKDSDRLRAIFTNIVKNGGKFKP